MENEAQENLIGTVEDVSYYNEATGFCVAEVNTGEEGVTVVGELGALAVGAEVECRGVWVMHPSFGRQFKAQTAVQTMPADVGGILKFLSSGIIRGIREATATKIVEKFGTQTFDVLENDPARLATIKGISSAKAREICTSFKAQFSAREMLTGLTNLGLSQSEAIKTYNLLKDDALDVLCANPYSLIGAQTGITFDKAEEIADNLTEKPPFEYRAIAGVCYVLHHNLGNGHTCIPREKMIKPASQLLGCDDDNVEIAIDNAIEQRAVVQRKINGRDFLFLPEIYHAERGIADRFRIMVEYPPAENKIHQSEIYAFEKSSAITFDDKQREAIEYAVSKGMLILTGGPGTGKTTTVKGIIQLMKNRGLKVCLAAPTGRAAQRMEELTGYEASTIHRLLEVEFKENDASQSFVHNLKNPLDCDAVIVDELSMVDVTLFAALLDALPLHCRLIMVGDQDQLPPVGAGNVLRDMIDSGVIPVVVLDKVFRQAMKSRIITNAHRVVKGEMPEFDNSAESDFFLLRENSRYLAPRKILDLVTKRLPAGYGLDPMNDIQVLCPSRKGEVGTQNINAILQEALNPPSNEKHEIRYKGYTLREGDRVMQIKNNYDVPWFKIGENGTGVFNGDIGVLTRIDKANDVINVRFDDKEAMYSIENVKELELAYAMTVHKSQGSEFAAVVMPVLAVPERLAYRNLFYTALTRAKSLLVLVGNEQGIQQMVNNDKKSRRYSALKYFIENDDNDDLLTF
ncbi:ATP-dependent RecD-like DNA helicase [uncultured Eubacterium sp.]|uniref:SF1B family DNA helicase RecD2 n=1 Tax=uncultured Eubacterium sp. TaxID=165185 RepID=UPI0025D51EEB|nr:ATP-dependent RecD-like DNA helicase [uncultured Eubacterium sp.]